MQNDEPEIGIVILAAGASTRMGHPKQLLKWQGETLIRRIVNAALATASPTLVVLGANAARIRPEVPNKPILIVENKDWQQGMSTSVRVGLQVLLEAHPALAAVLFLLTDQPFVTADYLRYFISRFPSNDASILASAYDDRLGVPALFARRWFGALMELQGDQGARSIIRRHPEAVQAVPFPKGKFDLDTPEDFARLIADS